MSAIWLLDIEYAGTPLRFASTRVVVPSREAGADVVYEAGLDPDLVVEIGSESVAVMVNIPGGVAATRAAHGPLRGRPARLRLWRSEPALEDARLVVAGRVSGASWGAAGEDAGVCELEIGQSTDGAANTIVKPEAVIDRAAWPDAPDNVIGEVAPVVFGRPGDVLEAGYGGGDPFPGSPAFVVALPGANKRLLLACHHVVASSVTIFDVTDGSVAWSGTATVTNTTDGAGNECATCLVSQVDSPADNTDVYVAWVSGGGVRHNGEAARGLGSVLLMAATNSPVAHDIGRMQHEAISLDRLLVDAVVNDVDMTWDEWLDSILPGFGVVRVNGPAGRFYREARTTPDPTNVRATLVLDQGGGGYPIEKVGPESEEDVGPATQVRMMYGQSALQDTMMRWVTLSAESNPDDARVVPHPACYKARELFERFMIPIPLVGYLATADVSTALECARKLADASCVPGSTAMYVGSDELGAAVAEYDTVEVVENGVRRLGVVLPGMAIGELTTEITVRFA